MAEGQVAGHAPPAGVVARPDAVELVLRGAVGLLVHRPAHGYPPEHLQQPAHRVLAQVWSHAGREEGAEGVNGCRARA